MQVQRTELTVPLCSVVSHFLKRLHAKALACTVPMKEKHQCQVCLRPQHQDPHHSTRLYHGCIVVHGINGGEFVGQAAAVRPLRIKPLPRCRRPQCQHRTPVALHEVQRWTHGGVSGELRTRYVQRVQGTPPNWFRTI